MSAIPNKKISKIIIFFDSPVRPDTNNAWQPPPLSDIALNKKTEDTKTTKVTEEGSLAIAKGLDNNDEISSNENGVKTAITINGTNENESLKNSSETTTEEINKDFVDADQNILLTIKEEPVENFEIENIEAEETSIVNEVRANVISEIKDEPETILMTNFDTRSTLNDYVNKLIETKIPDNRKQMHLPIANQKNFTVNKNTSSANSNNNKSSKCKESKCNRCNLIQKTFNALACADCRQSLEPLWKLGLGSCSKTYRCKYANCSKSYARQGDLKIHHRVHTGERPYACSICEKRFSANNNLRRHLKVHTGDKPFACQRCGKRFMTNSCLKRHVRVHTSSPAISTSFGYGSNLLQSRRE